MAKARDIPGMDRDIPYAAAAARVVAVRADELIEHAGGVLEMTEIERVHDMRVATRRLRAALEIFRPCFPRDQHKAALREVKAIADALGERRDRDVSIAALTDFAESLPAGDRPGVESLVGILRGEQRRANEELTAFVGQARLAALRERLDGLVVEAERRAEAGTPGTRPQAAGRSNGAAPEESR